MAYKRKRPAWPRQRKRRNMRTTMIRPVKSSVVWSKVHSFKRNCTIRTITGDGVATTQFFGFNFKLGDLPGATDFTNLYDQYKFTGVKLRFYFYKGEVMRFQKSSDTGILENLLSEAKVGELITYQKMSEALGRDVRQYAMNALCSARKMVLKNKQYVFGTECSQGLRRLDDSAIVMASEEDRTRMLRQARRAITKLSCVKFDELNDVAKRKHIVASAQFGAVEMFSKTSATKKITEAVKDKTVMPIGETLKLFG